MISIVELATKLHELNVLWEHAEKAEDKKEKKEVLKKQDDLNSRLSNNNLVVKLTSEHEFAVYDSLYA